jgi:hypothetical protein
MVPKVQPGMGGTPKIIASNRLNIVCLERPTPDLMDHMFYTVTKFAWNPTDMVPRPYFTPEMGWDSTTQENTFGRKGQARDEETKITLPWPHTDGSPVTLGFGTCQDVLVDKHPTERMVVFCGSGTPFMRLPNDAVRDLPMTYPFLLNDKKSWSVIPRASFKIPPDFQKQTQARLREDQLYAAGYYQFLNVAPIGAPNVAGNFADLYNSDGTAHAVQDRKSMASCYLNPPPIESNAAAFTAALANESPILVSTTLPTVPLFKYTDVLPIPPARKV